ncbi:hypothetical protein JVT61DRAFT_15630 [Boletus reticuloceps]|uniref:Uncharacterized protein n=1 Tax=Boletus reticuloceps TaxID=495285 RepID=A0A8I2YC60_9AGAM|nr:hypothetical protein JVT61DRAFT_15630 [Boletus reticuloceps]
MSCYRTYQVYIEGKSRHCHVLHQVPRRWPQLSGSINRLQFDIEMWPIYDKVFAKVKETPLPCRRTLVFEVNTSGIDKMSVLSCRNSKDGEITLIYEDTNGIELLTMPQKNKWSPSVPHPKLCDPEWNSILLTLVLTKGNKGKHSRSRHYW